MVKNEDLENLEPVYISFEKIYNTSFVPIKEACGFSFFNRVKEA